MRSPAVNLIFLFLCIFLIGNQTIWSQNTFSQTEEFALQSQKNAEELSRIWKKETILESIDLFLKSVEMWNKSGDFPQIIKCNREIARLMLILGEKNAAYNLLEKTLLIARSHDLLKEKVILLSELSFISLETGRVEQSRKQLNEALFLTNTIDNPAAKASVFFTAAEFNYYQQKLETAEQYSKNAVKLSQTIGDVESEAKNLLSLGYIYMSQGRYFLSLETLADALSKYKLIANIRGQAITQIALGHVLTSIDDKQQALDNYYKAEALFPPDLDFIEKARLYNGIGSIYSDFQELELSLNYRKQALRLFKNENHSYGMLATFTSLGKVSYLNHQIDEAVRYLSEAEMLAVKLNDSYYLAITRAEKGNSYYITGNFEMAKTFYQPALVYFKQIDSKREIALISEKLGRIEMKRNNLSSARKYLESALVLNEEVRSKFSRAETLYQIALLDTVESNSLQALQNVRESIETTENLSSNVINSKLKSTYFSNVFDRYELYINLLMKIRKASPSENQALLALQVAERSKARSLLENLSLSDAEFTKDANPETVKREQEIRVLLNTKADKLTDLLSQNAEKTETDKISGEINELENELENIKAALKLNSPIYSAIKNPAPFDVGEFQSKILDENSVLLEFSFGKDDSYLWLVEKDAVSSYFLPPRDEIESRIEKLRELLASREMMENEALEDFQIRIKKAEAEYDKEAKILSEQLFGQTAGKIQNKRLIIVPDGKLHYFPVSALPSPETGETFLLSNETVYAPSAQTLLLLEKNREQQIETAKNLLIFSDPVFTKDDPRILSENLSAANTDNENAPGDKFRFVESLNSLPRLQASKNESDSILEIVDKSSADSFSGFAATRQKLLDIDAKNYKILHFATHGVTDEKRPELSGIVLSRFNEKSQPVDEFFRIQDIYGLNLNADLVVLSACETGIGKEVKGEGLMSLNNAFLQTGAKTVMASLWKVEDTATLELMKNFYGGIVNENLTPSQSLRQAQIKLRENNQYRSPFYWAAFTVQGDFRNVPKISHGFNKYYFAAALIPLVILGLYIYRRRKKRQ